MTRRPLGRNWVSMPLRWFVAWWCMGCLFCQWCTSLSPRRIPLSSSEGFFKPCSLLWPRPPGITQFLDRCNEIPARSLLQLSLRNGTLQRYWSRYICIFIYLYGFIYCIWTMACAKFTGVILKDVSLNIQKLCGSHLTIVFITLSSLSLKISGQKYFFLRTRKEIRVFVCKNKHCASTNIIYIQGTHSSSRIWFWY